jgi:hypothetical protein
MEEFPVSVQAQCIPVLDLLVQQRRWYHHRQQSGEEPGATNSYCILIVLLKKRVRAFTTLLVAFRNQTSAVKTYQ